MPASFSIKHRSEELIVFFITLREELAESMPFKICAVQLVLSLESRKIYTLLDQGEIVGILASNCFEGSGGARFIFGG